MPENPTPSGLVNYPQGLRCDPRKTPIRLPSPQEMANSGLKITDLDQVEAVHFAGEFSTEELKSRLA
jgi:hypothetical protein